MLPTVPPAVVFWFVAVVKLIDPLTACDANAVENATEPPELAVPETTRRALLLCVVDFVHPVGAAVCANSITVPDGNADGAAPELAEVTRPFASTVTVENVYVPAATPELARVPVPVTLAEPLKLPLVYVRSPVMAMVRPVVSVAAEPVVFWFSVGTSAA